ncbi:uncharacterized protein OCT59_013423 [Rhizophagus irregularis]|uniref:uncharacterized protein n=1 Tax=Rhizophagus irregularis TaxID=588596 RepID=UPI0033260DA1|nr:hypothetical protein OCT59_013423 [Rhizophagus irregularis]
MVRLSGGLPKYKNSKDSSAVRVGFRNTETPKIHKFGHSGDFRRMEKTKFSVSGRASEFRRMKKTKIRSGGLSKNKNPKIKIRKFG